MMLRLCFPGTGFLLALCCSPLLAEEQAPFMEAAGYAPLVAYAPLPLASVPASDWWVTTPRREPNEPLEWSPESRAGIALQVAVRPGRLNAEAEFALATTRMPSRHAYDAWAGLHMGYGQFFPEDHIGRSRTNGVGFQENDWLYVKMSFRF